MPIRRITSLWREWRHSPCLMRPLSALVLFLLATFSLIVVILSVPSYLIGFILAPLAQRSHWFVEFLYPLGIARWGHLLLVKWGSDTNTVTVGTSGALSKPLHSRSIEQRTEVVKGRVYIHPLPQLLDNIGYLIVCTPPPHSDAPILGLIVDCAEADSVWDQVELIRDVHYSHIKNSIAIHSILSTHKHHDHTAGNRHMIRHPIVGVTLKQIYGGAVDNVPFATQQVTNGSFISLPFVGDNDMGSLIEIECMT